MVDSSNESLYHPEEEFDPNLRTGIPLQNSSEIVDVSDSKATGYAWKCREITKIPGKYRESLGNPCKPGKSRAGTASTK